MSAPTSTPSLAQLIGDAIEARLLDVHTAIPAAVTAFDPASQSADVQVLVNRVVEDEDTLIELPEPVPPIRNVPVIYPAGGGWSITWPLLPGDIVYLVFAERSIDQWLDAAPGTPTEPGSARMHDYSDAVAIPGLRPRSDPLTVHTTDFVVTHAGGATLTLKPDGTVEVEGTSIALKAPQVDVGDSASEPVILGQALATAAGGLGATVTGSALQAAILGALSSSVKVST